MQTHPYLNTLRQPETLSANLSRLAAEVARLEAEHLKPIAAGVRAGRLCIELAVSPRLSHLASIGEAAYYRRGHDDAGPYRRGMLLRQQITVFWTERGN